MPFIDESDIARCIASVNGRPELCVDCKVRDDWEVCLDVLDVVEDTMLNKPVIYESMLQDGKEM